MMSDKLPLEQDVDYTTSYADGFFLKLDHETRTTRLVFYKKDVRFHNGTYDSLPDEFANNVIFEVRIPNSALVGFLDISEKFNKYREETEKEEEAMEDEEVSETFSEYADTLASSTFDTSNPDEHDKELDKKFYYYLTKRQAKTKETTSENDDEESD